MLLKSLAKLLLIPLSLSAVCALAEPVAPLAPHSAEYKVRISILGGRLNTSLQQTEAGYAATHTIKPTGMSKMLARGKIEEQSEFTLNAEAVRPQSYSSIDELSRDKTRATIEFDWEAEELNGTVNDEAVSMALESLWRDRVSIQYQLMHDLKRGELGSSYQLFDIDEVKTLAISNIGEKEIKVRAGTFTAVGIQHQAEGSSRKTTLWCVAELDYLPVLIEQHRKGKLQMKATLERYTPDPSQTISQAAARTAGSP